MLGNVAPVTNREISIVQGQSILPAVVVKGLQGSLEKSKAPVVAKSLSIMDKVAEVLEDHFVSSCWLDLQLGRLPHGHRGREIADNEGNCFSVITV